MTARTKEEQLERWFTNYREFAEDLLMVQTVDGGLVPFKFNNVQIAIDEIIGDIRADGRLVRVIIDKLRRAGCSTYFAGRDHWLPMMNPRTNTLMITHEPEATDTIFGMHKRFHANMPKRMRPQVLYDNRKALVFNTKDRIGGLDSEIRVGTAGKENLGSSQLVNYAHWSEFSKWNSSVIDSLITSLMPTIPDTPESELVIESTANGIGNKYHSMWLAARYEYIMYLDDKGQLAWRKQINAHAKEDNIWSRIFIPWFVFEKCAMTMSDWERATGQPFVPDAEEEDLARTHLSGCPRSVQLQKLAWYRYTLENKFNGDRARRSQEYPTTWQESFMSSGEAAFDPYYVQSCLEIVQTEERKNPCTKYEVDPISGQFLATKKGRLWVWEEAIPGQPYGIVADASAGIVVDDKAGSDSKHDFSAVSVKHQLTGIEVAHWHGKIDPDLFGQLLVALAIRYNHAWLIPENNNMGNTVIAAMLRKNYKKIYVERVLEFPHKVRKRYGFSTTGNHYQNGTATGVRAEAVNAFIARVRDKRHGIRYPGTFEEMLSFKRDEKGKFKAESGQHDDNVIIECIWAFAGPLLPLPAQMSQPVGVGGGPAVMVPRGVPAMASTGVVEGGWT